MLATCLAEAKYSPATNEANEAVLQALLAACCTCLTCPSGRWLSDADVSRLFKAAHDIAFSLHVERDFDGGGVAGYGGASGGGLGGGVGMGVWMGGWELGIRRGRTASGCGGYDADGWGCARGSGRGGWMRL